MSVRWDASDCEAQLAADKLHQFSDERNKYRDMRDSLIYALLTTKFPKGNWEITDSNWKEIYKRINILEKTTYAWRSRETGNGVYKEVFFTPAEIFSMIGLRVNAGNQTTGQFMKQVWSMADGHATNDIQSFEADYMQGQLDLEKKNG
jgi:hypothetical protein